MLTLAARVSSVPKNVYVSLILVFSPGVVSVKFKFVARRKRRAANTTEHVRRSSISFRNLKIYCNKSLSTVPCRMQAARTRLCFARPLYRWCRSNICKQQCALMRPRAAIESERAWTGDLRKCTRVMVLLVLFLFLTGASAGKLLAACQT